MMSGGTKRGEISRTSEMLADIAKDQGAYFVVAMLYDSGYERADLKLIMDDMEKRRLGMEPHLKSAAASIPSAEKEPQA